MSVSSNKSNTTHMKYHYAAFDQITSQVFSSVKPYLKSRVTNILGYDKNIVVNRLLQRFIQLEMDNIQKKASLYARGEYERTIFDENVIELCYFKYYPKSGKLSLKHSYLAKSFLKFFVRWIQVFLLYLLSLLKIRDTNNRKATLVYGVHQSNFFKVDGDKDFINFCQNGFIEVLSKASLIIVQSCNKVESSNPKFALYAKNPLHALLFNKNNSFNDLIFFCNMHFKAMYFYMKSLYCFPLMALLDEDIAYHALASILNKNLLIDNILITNSNLVYQPLWMNSLARREYKLHMAWYSQNQEFSYIFKWDPIQTASVAYGYVIVDENWVWTKYFADNLLKAGVQGLFHCIGPILWYLPVRFKSEDAVDNSINISIFDITPHGQDRLEKQGWKDACNYGSYRNLSNFIIDIVNVINKYSECRNRKVKLLLKHKRDHLSSHDKDYIALVDSLSKKGDIDVISPDANMFSLISSSKISIVLPYSSPAQVANYLKVPAIFYDPSQELIPFFERSEKVFFASGKDELESKVFELLE